MKTEVAPAGEHIWTNNVELLGHEECLPVIGSCQVTSILQNLSTNEEETNNQNMDLIILPATDIKLASTSFNIQNNYVILNENGNATISNCKTNVVNTEKTGKINKRKKDNFENMLYFVCNLCPYLCTKDSKIKEHLENAHKNKTIIKLPELKCPACTNIFHHRMSLRSHLIHDHGVGSADLNQIIQAVIYYSSKSSNKNKNEDKEIIKKDPELLAIKEILSTENQINESSDVTNFIDEAADSSNETVHQKKEPKLMTLPQVDITQKNCEKIFGNLMKHSDRVTKYIDTKRLNKCIVSNCKVRLQDIEKLNYHIDCHSDDGFKCSECGEKFLFWKPLTSHLWRLHRIDMELYSCDKCDYKSFSLAKLNNVHKLIHSEIRGYLCDICNKSFKNNKQLGNHKMTHKNRTDRVLHICEECSRTFTDRRQLKIHLDVVHKKIRPYLCNYCGYKGSSRSSLKMHIRQHTGEKPFSCDSCSYTTSDHNSLRRHKLRHTGQKPYKCTYCSYACIQSSTYKTHLKTKHPGMEKDLMFTCRECQFRSVNKEMYHSHLITVHRINSQT